MIVRARGESGFTLMEVLVALLIVATTVAVLQDVSSATLKDAIETNRVRVAKMLLKTKLEEIEKGIETATSGDFRAYYGTSYPGYEWEMAEASQPVGKEEAVRAIMVTVRYPTLLDPNAYREENFYEDPTMADISDLPGMMRATLYVDPPEAKLEPPPR